MRKILRFIPSLLWMSFIFFLSAQSTTGIGQTKTSRFLILKTFHLIEYATLYILFYFSLRRKKPAMLLSYLYALSDEFHQTLVPGREGKITDTFIDLFGIVIGIFIVKKLIRISLIKKYL
tara:strand:- start:264 stop:623 length:360 start_codon:yes stop_codon:yes gene_type:complete